MGKGKDEKLYYPFSHIELLIPWGIWNHLHLNWIVFFVLWIARPNFAKRNQAERQTGKFLPKPLLFRLRHPKSKTNEPKFWQILFPRKIDFRFAESVLKPHALPEYLKSRTRKKKHPFLFKRNLTPAKSEMQGVFFLSGFAEALRGSGGTIRAYEAV